ncbi:MAG: TonB-dependent receptor [Gemmatimonadetes bacterium]|nr:TonB-dependent receptor [Gemmatimonadota bacterium]MYG23064.1 TonB-dependent receptor [Gemmatimonadota bacterium]MYJ40369.1 TonB-dependent receptor [Gemmatimonadota bacterium]
MSRSPHFTADRTSALAGAPSRARTGKPLRALAVLACTTPMVLGSGTAHAQTEAEDTVELAPIVVTVLRSPVRLDRLPFSASVLAGSVLSEGNTGLFIEEALHSLPGVRVQNRYNPAMGERISIRGFGARAQFGVRGIKILVDGIPATLPDGQTTLDHLDIGSLGRVEALRGPAAALYGNGAGGVILFESATPYAGPYSQQASVVAGSDGLLRLQATGSGTADNLAFRASIAQHQFDGYRNNPLDMGDDPYSRATRTTVNAGVASSVGGGLLRVQLSGLDLDALNAGSLPAALFDEGSNEAWGFNVRRGTRKYVRQGQAGVSWQGPMGGLEGTFSAYGVRRELDNPIPSAVIDLDRNGGGVRAALAREWETASGVGRVDFGMEGEVMSDARLNFRNDGGESGALTLDQQERVRAAALFGQFRLPVAGRLDAVGAVRFDHFNFRADDNFTAADNPDDSGTRGMSGLSPSLGFHLDLGRHGLFASVARSFETPTTTELANQPNRAGGFNPDLEPQRGWTVEGGLRGDLGGGVAYDLAAFSSNLTNQLVPFEVPSAPSRRFYRNVGRSRLRGFEASARTALSSSLSVRLTYGYVDARFTEFSVGGDDFADNRIPGIAPHRLEAGLRAHRGPWFGELRLEARDDVPANDANDAIADSFTLVDLRFGASEIAAGTLRLSPFVGITNLTNVRYATSVVVNAFGGRYFEPGPDRGGYLGLSLAVDRR